jgi:hypothetical protein
MCGHCDNETLPSTAANLYTKCSIQNNRKCLEKQNNILTIVANQMIPSAKFLLNDLLPTFVCKLVNLISLILLCSLKWTVKSIFFHVCRHDNHFYQIAFFSDQSETFVSRQLFTERVHYVFYPLVE